MPGDTRTQSCNCSHPSQTKTPITPGPRNMISSVANECETASLADPPPATAQVVCRQDKRAPANSVKRSKAVMKELNSIREHHAGRCNVSQYLPVSPQVTLQTPQTTPTLQHAQPPPPTPGTLYIPVFASFSFCNGCISAGPSPATCARRAGPRGPA